MESQDLHLNPTSAAVLGLLRQWGPMNANALAVTANVRIGGYWTVTRSQVYRELDALEKRGFVKFGPQGPRNSRECTVTDVGAAAFLTWLASGPTDDVIRFPLLLTVRFAADLPPGRFDEIIEEFSTMHAETLAMYRSIATAAVDGPFDKYDLATLRFGIRFEEAIELWLGELDEILGRRVRRARPRECWRILVPSSTELGRRRFTAPRALGELHGDGEGRFIGIRCTHWCRTLSTRRDSRTTSSTTHGRVTSGHELEVPRNN